MTRVQRNALADVIVAALRERAAHDALATLARVLATTDPVAVAPAAAVRLVAARIVVAAPAVSADATVAHVALAPDFAAVRAEARARVERARLASDGYWRTSATPSEHARRDTAEADLDACLRRAAALFDARLYFEVHEELEALWRRIGGAPRVVVQGLLQIAVALHHAENGNVDGARRLLAAGRVKVEPFAPLWHGVAIDALLGDLRRWERARLDRGEDAAAPRLTVR